MKIYLRPHHGLCILLFSEEGHSAGYAAIMRKYISKLSENLQTEVILCAELDGICGICRHNNNSACEMAPGTEVSDERILEYCGLKFGGSLTWEELRKKLVDDIVAKGRLHNACEGCSYLSRCEKTSSTVPPFSCTI